jgi:hypothetical protein
MAATTTVSMSDGVKPVGLAKVASDFSAGEKHVLESLSTSLLVENPSRFGCV